MELTSVLMKNYLPYAKGTIIDRALPFIDGLKPSQRKILYTMYTMKLLKGNKTKSSNIVGRTMSIHPHGDATIYDTLVRMSTGNETLNVPYIEGKGNFGKVYSRELAYAAPRYTEAKLAAICEEMFDGIDEEAVEFQNNFDDTLTEPVLLPVKFPNILTNASSGIAVGLGSSMAPFGLENVCRCVIGILDGSIKTNEDLVNVLGIPQFSTGGNVHTTKADMIKFVETGRGSFTVSGTAVTYSDHIVISEIPYKTSSEAIIEAIESHIKTGELKEVSNVIDETDLHGFRISVNLRRGSNPQAVLKKLMRLTPLRTQISFSTKLIVNDKCEAPGIFELFNMWIDFRLGCLNNLYTHRFNKASEKEHLLATWEKIKTDIPFVVKIISTMTESQAKVVLMDKFNMDNIQAEYLLDMRIRDITVDRLNKKLIELAAVRANIAEYDKILKDDNEKYKIIIDDQKRIIDKYAKSNKTRITAPIVEDDEKEPAPVIDDSPAVVVLAESGYMKRLLTIQSMTSYELPDGEVEKTRFSVKNNGHLLVFTYSGEVHKIPVNDIDASRGKLKDNVADMAGVTSKDIMFIDYAGDYTKYFNLVYANGRGTRVSYSRAKGNRSKYKSLFDESKPGEVWWTFEDKFFMVTKSRKAAYCDLTNLGMFNTRTAFKVARVNTGDSIFKLLDAKDVPDIDSIDLSKYNKDYTVLIGEDELWAGAREKYLEALALIEENRRKAAEEKARLREEAKAEKRRQRNNARKK